MKYLIGLGLSEHDQGAVELAAWLAVRDASVRALHAVDPRIWAAVEDGTTLQKFAGDIKRAAGKSSSGSAMQDNLEIVVDPRPESALERAARGNVDAVIVGRRAHTESRQVIRLGRVTRRMLRQLACATVVTPPDLNVAQLDAGPIVLATDLDAASAGAARFVKVLARELRRDIVVVHIHPDSTSLVGQYVPSALYGTFFADIEADATHRATQWLQAHALEDARLVFGHGYAASALLEFAEESNASLLVCGSRRAGATERFFTSTVGGALASHARVPVAVVPSDWQPGLATKAR